MTQYIPKDAVVAEIEKRKDICEKVMLDLRTQENKAYYHGKAQAYGEVLDYLDTLEVNSGKEMSKYLGDDWKKDAEGEIENEMVAFAKHFIELGLKLKAQKGE